MIFWYAITAVFVNVFLFGMAWPSIRARRIRRRLKSTPVLTWERYQNWKVVVKLSDGQVMRGGS